MNSPRLGLAGWHGQAKSARAAFTLVELLVVITIIGMLVALLMPAVNNARSAAQQANCINNMRNYAMAVQAYVTSKEDFPGYRMSLKQNTGATPSPYPSVSWQVALLPQLQRTDLYQTWQNYSDKVAANTATPADNPSIPYMELSVCPSDNTDIGTKDPWTSYVVNGGTLDKKGGNDPRTSLADIYEYPTGSDQGYPMGVFQNLYFRLPPPGPGALLKDRPKRLSLTDIRDGQSTTMMISENLNARYYAWATDNQNDQDNSERGTCFLHWWQLPEAGTFVTDPAQPKLPSGTAASGVTAAEVAVINGDKSRLNWDPDNTAWWPNPYTGGTPDGKYYSARPSSNHAGGVVVAYVDASTRFLRDDIDYGVYCILMTPAGSKFRALSTPNGTEPTPPGGL